MTPFQLQHPNR